MTKWYKILITLFLITLFASCKQNKEYNGYAILEFYKVFQNGRVNINAYLLSKYDKKMSLNENIDKMKEMECLVLIMEEKEFRKLNKDIKFFSEDEFLANVKINLLEDYKKIKSEYYLLQRPKKNLSVNLYPIFQDFNSFEMTNLEKLNEEWYFKSFESELQ